MPFIFKRLALLLSIAALAASLNLRANDKDQKFTAGPAASYSHQTNAKVTIGVDAYVIDEKARSAFGKNNPYKSGVLPVLLVIQNGGDKAIRTDQLKAEYVAPDRDRVEATPASDVRYLTGPRRPNAIPGPTGVPKVLKRKNPLESWEIEGRAFAAKIIPPGESASGFLYFQTGYQRGSRIYLSGLTEAGSGKELFYFEIPLGEK